MRANQYWIFKPPLSDGEEPRNYSIQNYLSKLYLDVKDGEVVQTTNSTACWELRKKHDYSGEFYHTKAKRYLVKGK